MAVAKHHYLSQEEDEHSLRVGDVITDLEKVNTISDLTSHSSPLLLLNCVMIIQCDAVMTDG